MQLGGAVHHSRLVEVGADACQGGNVHDGVKAMTATPWRPMYIGRKYSAAEVNCNRAAAGGAGDQGVHNAVGTEQQVHNRDQDNVGQEVRRVADRLDKLAGPCCSSPGSAAWAKMIGIGEVDHQLLQAQDDGDF